jgi:hypothetical protein
MKQKRYSAASSHEQKLNEYYQNTIPDYYTAFEHFLYLTNPTRGKHTTKNNIIKHYNAGTLGTLLKNYDPIAFNVSKQREFTIVD